VVVAPDQHVGWARFRFEAAHRLPNVPADHKCGRMHGHGFEVLIESVNADAEALIAAWRPRYEVLHRACLNDLPGLENPTSEVLAAWLFERLADDLPELRAVTVMETASAGCRFDGRRWRIWKSSTFDSAVRLAHAPEGDARGRLHGHTFQARLHLAGELDRVYGWVEDYGDVKRRFDPVFRALDHRPLHEDTGLPDNDPASIAARIDSDMADKLPGLSRVDVLETPGRGALLLRKQETATGLLQP
jgi:6-pyruvoyltetrahydropterin/6-carboxytetrahydropterin synthase